MSSAVRARARGNGAVCAASTQNSWQLPCGGPPPHHELFREGGGGGVQISKQKHTIKPKPSYVVTVWVEMT